MISGATGAMAVVMVHMIQQGNEVGRALETPVENLGLQWLFITLLIVGGIQILAGAFKLGKFVRLIPHPVMMGFVNGLGNCDLPLSIGPIPRENRGGNELAARQRTLDNDQSCRADNGNNVWLAKAY